MRTETTENPCFSIKKCTRCCENITMHNIRWGEIQHIFNYSPEQFLLLNYEVWSKLNRAFYGDIKTILETIADRFEDSQNRHLIFLRGFDNKTEVIDNDTPSILIMNGPCPLLDEYGFCSEYKKRPTPCKNFRFEGIDCKGITEMGLLEVDGHQNHLL
jgi:Fe-S-cluster containining protein